MSRVSLRADGGAALQDHRGGLQAQIPGPYQPIQR